jgi:pyrroline-5-carboxylate reductase
MTVSLLLAGCGKMGGALLEGWLERGVAPGNVTIVEANRDLGATLAERHGVTVHETPDRIAASLKPDVVVLAVKPQMMDDVAPAYGRFTGPDTVFLSIAAGRPIAYFQDRLGAMAAIVRSMPNTPAAVRRGITVACPNERVSDGQKRTCHDLLEAVGEVAWVGDESLLDAVTALSGGGPAYVFFLVECLAKAGREAGLPADLAERLARVTVSGAGELLHRAHEGPEILRRNVTSPGGTTAEALKILMADEALQPLVTEAIAAAARRSRELAG